MPAGSVDIKVDLQTKNLLRQVANMKKEIIKEIGGAVSGSLDRKTATSQVSQIGKNFDKALKQPVKLREVGGWIGKFGKLLDTSMTKVLTSGQSKSKIMKAAGFLPKQLIKAGQYMKRAYTDSEINQKVGEGASAASQAHGQLAATTSGAFYSTVKGQMDAVKGIKDRGVETYNKWKESRAQAETRRLATQSSSQPEQGEKAQAESKRGGLLSAAGSGVMFLEGAAKALGYALNFTSEAGQKYLTILKSQSATIGSTGKYVGGGGGLFSNQAIAQGQVSLNKAMGNYGNVGIGGASQFGDMKKFAAEQNMGFSDFADAVGEFRRVKNDISVGFIKGIAESSKITGLKQGEFVKEISGHFKSLRQKGYGVQHESRLDAFTGFTAGLGQELAGTNSDPFGGQERAAQIMGQADVMARQAEGGGLIGAMNLLQELESDPNADFFTAKKRAEKRGYDDETKNKFSQIFGGNEGVAGYVLGQQMGLSQHEGEAFYRTERQAINTNTNYQAGENMGLAAQNAMEEGYMGNAGALQAAKTAISIQTQQLEQLRLLAPAMSTVANSVKAIEDKIFTGMGTLIDVGNKIVNKLF